MPRPIPPEATEGAYGALAADVCRCHPLDTVTVAITGRDRGDTACRIRVCDPEQRPYVEQEVALEGNRGLFRFTAGGAPGTHYLYLFWPDREKHCRYLNLRVEAETAVETGDPDFDRLYPVTAELMSMGRRSYETPRGRFVGYMSADTWHFDGIWLRDWIYGLPAFRHWEREMQCGLDRFLEKQDAAGMAPDGIERDGRTWRVGLESDVEYILVLAVWQAWQATGDDRWMAQALPRLERALDYIRRDPKHWDADRALVKRQHSCDTWDFDIDGANDKGESRHVIATCDQSGYLLAFRAMGWMHAALGHAEEAARWEAEARAYGERANRLLWDGTKFQHHVHLDPIDHGDFDETQQLAMGNTWAMTRGLATPDQARSIVDEYRRRHAETGDAHPWWSLQPGYPDRLGYFRQAYCQQGGYANGGLMPWVGGELCRAAFQSGREAYGVELLREYAAHLRKTGGAQVWYWPDGTPGFRTTNEVKCAGWGMAEWVHALLAGLAGVTDESALYGEVTLAPRWAAAGVREARVCAAYAASGAYAAYRWERDDAARELRLTVTGSGRRAAVRVLLPDGWTPGTVEVNGAPAAMRPEREDRSLYACLEIALAGVTSIRIRCPATA